MSLERASKSFAAPEPPGSRSSSEELGRGRDRADIAVPRLLISSAEARPTLEAAVELLGGKPSEKGAFLDAQVAMEDGMGRYGATSAKVATWREDLEWALPHLERLMADVLEHHLGWGLGGVG